MIESRELALIILNRVLNDNSYSNITLGSHLNNSNLNDKDKALVTEIVYGTIKYKYTIDKILAYFIKKKFKDIENDILNILRLTIYQIRYLDKIPEFAAVNEAVNMAKKKSNIGASKFVNGVLRNYLRNKEANFVNEVNHIEKICFDFSFEPWMVKLFIKQYGTEKAISICKGLNEVPCVSVRINNLKSDYDNVFKLLEENGYNIEEGYVCPEAIRIIKGKNIEQNLLFNEGYITVQDESAMLVAPSMDLEEGMTVFDLCSAPGGKTTHISEILNNTGMVKAFDLHENKLNLIRQNAERLGIKNIALKQMDSSKYEKQYDEACQRLLIDVPCSGLGIIRKKPEIKWNKSPNDIKDIVKIQREIMKNAGKYIKKDGVILYSTCTMNKEENEENIDWFLKTFTEFKVEPLSFGNIDNFIYNKQGSTTILPNKYMDAFFICKLRKMW